MCEPFKIPKEYRELLNSGKFSTKILVYFSSKVAGDDFDIYEENYTETNLNPKTLKGYFRQLSPERLMFKEYGLHKMGMAEVITEEKYRNWFENAERIVIEGNDYQVFRHATGNKSMIQRRTGGLIRVIVERKD